MVVIINNKFNILQYAWSARQHKFIFDSFALICTCVRNLLHRSAGNVLLGSSVPAALGLGSRINYNPLLRIEINDIGFVFYVGMGLLAMRGAPLDGCVNAADANWYRRSRSNEPSYAPVFLLLRTKGPSKIQRVPLKYWMAAKITGVSLTAISRFIYYFIEIIDYASTVSQKRQIADTIFIKQVLFEII